MSTSHRTSGATAVALASASLTLLGALLAPSAAATGAPPPPSTSAPATASASAAASPGAGGSAPTAGAGATTASTLVVQAGDTLTALARRAGTPGGWPALYAANRDAVGASPDRLVPGTVLVLPAARAAASTEAHVEAPVEAPVEATRIDPAPATTYVVEPGDSLRRIAERTGVRGGWPALYAANRAAVGADPDALAVGTRLVLPAAAVPRGGSSAPTAPAPAASAPGAGAPGAGSGASPSPSEPLAEPSQAPPAPDGAPRGAGLPSWVVWPMVVAAALALVVLLGDPLLGLLRRRRAQQLPTPVPAGQDRQAAAGAAAAGADGLVAPVAPVVPLRATPSRRPVVHVRGYASLLVTYSPADDLVLVLAPAGQDAEEALHLARVVLPGDVFRAVEADLPSALLAQERRRSSRLGA